MKEIDKIKNYKSVCLIGHIHPDCDAICSMVIFREFLKSQFNIDTIDLFADTEEINPKHKVILGNLKLNPKEKKYDVAVMIDAPNSSRLGKYEHLFDNAKYKLVIDHHATNAYQGDENIVEIISSTCEILYSILKKYKHEFTDKIYAMMYAGIITDTNNFQWGEMNAETFKIAGECFGHVDARGIFEYYLGSNSEINLKLYAIAINNIDSYADGRIAFAHVLHEDSAKLNAGTEDFLGIANRLSSIEGNQITCFIEPRGKGYNYEMRAKPGFDISNVAKYFGGGGHKGAAAFTSERPIEEMKKDLLAELSKQVKPIKEIKLF